MPGDYFDEWIAKRYRVLWEHLFAPEVVDPAVNFLAELPEAEVPSNSESARVVSHFR